MADRSPIEWTDATWNPITGCSIASPGCHRCYAASLADTRLKHHPSRVGLTRRVNGRAVFNGNVRFNSQWIDQPLRWRKPRNIFVVAHGDLFHENVPDEWIDRVYSVMGKARQHQFQVLTKRADRMRAYTDSDETLERLLEGARPMDEDHWLGGWPLPNVWAGVSVENQKYTDLRVPDLMATPAAVRYVSVEPLLGPMTIKPYLSGVYLGSTYRDAHGVLRYDVGGAVAEGLDWVIVGGESGNGARPMHPHWARRIRDECAATRTPYLFKQWGSWAPTTVLNSDNRRGTWILPDGSTPVADSFLEAHRDGRAIDWLDTEASDRIAEVMRLPGSVYMAEMSKKKAGRTLDGRLHDGMPR